MMKAFLLSLDMVRTTLKQYQNTMLLPLYYQTIPLNEECKNKD